MHCGYGPTVTEPKAAFVELRPLPLMNKRAVGGPVSRRLLTTYFTLATVCWLAAAAVTLVAAPDVAAGQFLAPAPVLAVHLIGLGALPLAVSGACFHLLPVMLRNDLPSERLLWVALFFLAAGPLLAVGVAHGLRPLVFVAAPLLALGLVIVLGVVARLVIRAPRGRALIASRVGVSLVLMHVVAALVVGLVIFDLDRPFAGVSYERWLLVHLHIALLGWIALLVITVGRNLVPMLARAPAAPARRFPVDELALAAGLWLLVAGLLSDRRAIVFAAGVLLVSVMAHFALLTVRVVRSRRGSLEAPLVHIAVGAFFLAQAALVGLLYAAGVGGRRLATGYCILLLVGWAGGVVIGHVGKLLSLSLWVWWPPGPRPRQQALYPRRLGLAEAVLFAVGVELLAVGAIAGSKDAAEPGAVALLASALLATVGPLASMWLARKAREAV